MASATSCGLSNGSEWEAPATQRNWILERSGILICRRPGRGGVNPPGEVPPDCQSVGGRVEGVGYLGNALVYTVVLDWVRLEVRRGNQPGGYRPHAGDDVAVSWTLDAISVVRA